MSKSKVVEPTEPYRAPFSREALAATSGRPVGGKLRARAGREACARETAGRFRAARVRQARAQQAPSFLQSAAERRGAPCAPVPERSRSRLRSRTSAHTRSVLSSLSSSSPGRCGSASSLALDASRARPGAARARARGSYLVDPASSHMLVSKIKPCMSKYAS